MTARLQLLLLAGTLLSSEAACPCMPTPNDTSQVSAPGKPAYVGEAAAYGWGCAAHDAGMGNGSADCGTVTDTAAGEPNDWCLDQWCIVDKDNCTTLQTNISYTAADDIFSYETCDANFAGNGWVGRCKNCPDHPTSFCACGGLASCPCKAISSKQTSAVDKPAYVGEAEAYGSGCKAHDGGMGDGAADCGTVTNTAAGEPNDWCLDQWCIIDKDNCNFLQTNISYTAADDQFSYETCDANFAGNGWVGRCTCAAPLSNSYCTCPESTTVTTVSTTETNGTSTTGTNGTSTSGGTTGVAVSAAFSNFKLEALATSFAAVWVGILVG